MIPFKDIKGPLKKGHLPCHNWHRSSMVHRHQAIGLAGMTVRGRSRNHGMMPGRVNKLTDANWKDPSSLIGKANISMGHLNNSYV